MKTVLALLTVLCVSAILASGCATLGAKSGDIVKLNYTLKLDDGAIYTTTSGKQPFEVTLGKGTLIPGFEEAVIGMRVGEVKTVKLPPEKAYGPHRPELVESVSRSKLPESVQPVVGYQLQATDKDGKPFPVVITEVNDSTVTVDANPPLAGKNLTFDIELLSITNGTSASSSPINQTNLSWMLLALVGLVSGLTWFYVNRRQRRLQQVRIGLARKSEGMLAALARLDDDFEGGKIGEEAYRMVRAEKKAQLVELIQQLNEERARSS